MNVNQQYILGYDTCSINNIVSNLCHRSKIYHKLRLFILPKIMTNPSSFDISIDYLLDIFAVSLYKLKEKLNGGI